MNNTTLCYILTALTVIGTIAGAVQSAATAGSLTFRVAAFLAGLLPDLRNALGDAFGKPKAAAVAKSLLMLVIVGTCFGCLSSAPTVPVTPANQSQITTCENIATLHDGVVIGDFVLGGAGTGLGSAAALVNDTNAKNDLAIVGIGLAGAVVIGTAVAELTASSFANNNCPSVVGALPSKPAN